MSEQKNNPAAPFKTTPEFIDGFIHETRTPLTILKGLPLYLDKNKLSEEEQEYCDLAERNITTINNFIDKTAEGLKGQSGLTHIYPISSHLSAIRGLVYDLLKDTGFPNIYKQLIFHMPPHLAEKEYIFDYQKLTIAFSEIVKNGLFFNQSAQKKVNVYVYEKDQHLIFDFEDNGIGIEKADWEKIFALLTVISPSRTKTECGLGTGLTIARGIILAHHGRLFITQSIVGEKTCFRAMFPLNKVIIEQR